MSEMLNRFECIWCQAVLFQNEGLTRVCLRVCVCMYVRTYIVYTEHGVDMVSERTYVCVRACVSRTEHRGDNTGSGCQVKLQHSVNKV